MKPICMKLPPKLDEKILEYCNKIGTTRSEFIRNAIIKELERIDSTYSNSEKELLKFISVMLKQKKEGKHGQEKVGN